MLHIYISPAIQFLFFIQPLSNAPSNSTRPTHRVEHCRKAQYLAFYNKHTAAWAAAKHLNHSVKLHCSCCCCCCCAAQILQRLLQHRVAAAQCSSAASKIKFRLQRCVYAILVVAEGFALQFALFAHTICSFVCAVVVAAVGALPKQLIVFMFPTSHGNGAGARRRGSPAHRYIRFH